MTEAWQLVAWRLWRRQGYSIPQVTQLLRSEGWDVEPPAVAESINEQLHRKLNAGNEAAPPAARRLDRRGEGPGAPL